MAELPKVTLKSHEEVIAEAMKDPAFREAYEHLEPRPTSEQRAYFWRLTIGAIKVIVAGLILALVLGVGPLIVSRGG